MSQKFKLPYGTVIDGPISGSYISTDPTLSANSDEILATQKATKSYIDNRPSGGGLSWQKITGSVSGQSNKGYIANSGSRISVSLPASSSAGDTIRILALGSGGWKITQGSGQVIRFGILSTITGTSGYIASSDERDAVELLCVTDSLEWVVISSVGNIEVN